MIHGTLLRRLLALSGLLLVLCSGTALWVGGSPAMAGGLALGFGLGMAPFASWAWIAVRGWSTRRSRIVTALLIGAKLGLYVGLLYLLVARGVVNPIGVLVGITAVVLVVSVGTLAASSTPPKEAA